ncbi:MAG: DNA alkylation repair enzyme [Bacteroidetes bacterium HLUCCA01]|nr:MAG: DNA alkylation repair enzyme [Bacteroidetes bacterium HLUCCA01]
MPLIQSIKNDLERAGRPERVADLARFFQCHPGGYGEGDFFWAVTVPAQRSIAKRWYRETSLGDLQALLRDPVHECRLTALFMMIHRYDSGWKQQDLIDLYFRSTDYINNWDLVDSSAYQLPGKHYFPDQPGHLYELAQRDHLWEQRIAMVATMYYIRKGVTEHTFAIADTLLNHPHDLIHKATGWLIREAAKKDFEAALGFLLPRYQRMPRTMLRYAIERFDEPLRQDFLKGRV